MLAKHQNTIQELENSLLWIGRGLPRQFHVQRAKNMHPRDYFIVRVVYVLGSCRNRRERLKLDSRFCLSSSMSWEVIHEERNTGKAGCTTTKGKQEMQQRDAQKDRISFHSASTARRGRESRLSICSRLDRRILSFPGLFCTFDISYVATWKDRSRYEKKHACARTQSLAHREKWQVEIIFHMHFADLQFSNVKKQGIIQNFR